MKSAAYSSGTSESSSNLVLRSFLCCRSVCASRSFLLKKLPSPLLLSPLPHETLPSRRPFREELSPPNPEERAPPPLLRLLLPGCVPCPQNPPHELLEDSAAAEEDLATSTTTPPAPLPLLSRLVWRRLRRRSRLSCARTASLFPSGALTACEGTCDGKWVTRGRSFSPAPSPVVPRLKVVCRGLTRPCFRAPSPSSRFQPMPARSWKPLLLSWICTYDGRDL